MIKKYTLSLCLFILTTFITSACSSANLDDLIEDYMWENRLVFIFAPETDNQLLKDQLAQLQSEKEALKDRDIVRWIVVHQEFIKVEGKYKPNLSTNPFYDKFDVRNDEFTFILIGKDGSEKLRSNSLVTAKDIFAFIDSMPMRQREINSK